MELFVCRRLSGSVCNEHRAGVIESELLVTRWRPGCGRRKQQEKKELARRWIACIGCNLKGQPGLHTAPTWGEAAPARCSLAGFLRWIALLLCCCCCSTSSSSSRAIHCCCHRLRAVCQPWGQRRPRPLKRSRGRECSVGLATELRLKAEIMSKSGRCCCCAAC